MTGLLLFMSLLTVWVSAESPRRTAAALSQWSAGEYRIGACFSTFHGNRQLPGHKNGQEQAHAAGVIDFDGPESYKGIRT